MANIFSEKRLAIESFDVRQDSREGEIFAQFSTGIPQGLGTLTKEGNEVYLGSWKDGVYQGIGIMKVSSDHSYCGQFHSGKPKGFGMLRRGKKLILGNFYFDKMSGVGLYSKDDSEYKGTFENGVINGFGEFSQKSSSTVYRGNFKNSEYSGEGKLTSPKLKFVGQFLNNQKSGPGIQIDKVTGDKYIGYWNNDQYEAFGKVLTSDSKIYTGEWRLGVQQGVAMIEYSDKNFKYVGQVSSGLREGIGRIESPNFTYIGQWNQNKMHGIGIEILKDGSIYFGYWKDNKKNGLGKEAGPEFNFKGEWRNSKPHGKGYLVPDNKQVVIVCFDDGQIIETIEDDERLKDVKEGLNQLDYDSFNDTLCNKINIYERQIESTMIQIEQELHSIEANLPKDEAKLDKSMMSIIQQADDMVAQAKHLEILLQSARYEFDAKHSKMKNRTTTSPDSIAVDKVPEKTIPNIGSHDKKSANSLANDASSPLKTDKLENKDDEIMNNLELQAARLYEYEQWLIKEKQRLTDARMAKKRYVVNKEYSTKSMKEEEQVKLRRLFDQDYKKMNQELIAMHDKLQVLLKANEHLETTNKKLENYSNDVDTKNYMVSGSMETMKADTKKRIKDHEDEVKALKNIIDSKAKEIHDLKYINFDRDKEIASLADLRNQIETKLRDHIKIMEDLKFKYVRAIVEISALRIAINSQLKDKVEDNQTIADLKREISEINNKLQVERQSRQSDNASHGSKLANTIAAHARDIKSISDDHAAERSNHEKTVAKLKKQVRILENGGEVDDTDELLRLKEVIDLRSKNSELSDLNEKLKTSVDNYQAEVEVMQKIICEKDKKLKDMNMEKELADNKVNQLDETVRGLQLKQREWNEIKDALANNIKVLKDREQDLQKELNSKKILEQEEIQKRNSRLSKGFFKENLKPMILMGVGRLP